MTQKHSEIIRGVTSGFSMVELMVTVAIIAILSVGSIVGFGYLSDIMRTRQISGVIQDAVKTEELKVLRGDFSKSTVYFLKNYLITEQEPDGSDSKLLSLGAECGTKGYNLKISSQGSLTSKNQDGKVIEVSHQEAGEKCVEFGETDDSVLSYQLNNGSSDSDIISFSHFNLNRDNKINQIYIESGYGAKLEIIAPYSKKTFFDASGKTAKNISLTLKDENGKTSEELTLN